MSDLLVLDADKLRAARGVRTRAEIVNKAQKAFTEQQLYNWETRQCLPRPEKLPVLISALGVKWKDIASSISQEKILPAA